LKFENGACSKHERVLNRLEPLVLAVSQAKANELWFAETAFFKVAGQTQFGSPKLEVLEQPQ
jgi:hypothetical protein